MSWKITPKGTVQKMGSTSKFQLLFWGNASEPHIRSFVVVYPEPTCDEVLNRRD